MGINKADLILHPARLQILQVLAEKPMTTQDLADRLVGVPKSSIYRHMRALLDGGMVEVAETRPVKGTLEKFYRLSQLPHLSQEDIADFNRDDHLRYFIMYLASQLQGFSNYLEGKNKPDFLADHVGYSEAIFNVTKEELEEMLTSISQVLMTSAQNQPADGRGRHKFAFITYPFVIGADNHD